jgi:hypothetical protein|tara:strand:+ start:261 stop:686 length:426 start_codon:yes stop_codon:yes gene_type:complete
MNKRESMEWTMSSELYEMPQIFKHKLLYFIADEYLQMNQSTKGSKLAYWHNTGHAQVNENLFGVSQESLLKTFSDQLIGVHLHDVLNGHHDHYAPGCGMVDFDMVKSYLKTETIRVMELNQKVHMKETKQGIDFLKDKGIF